MTQLRITIFGDAMELLIGTFPKEGADWIKEYCEEFKPYTDIEEVWYGEGLIPKEWTKGKDWDDFDNIFHEFGFIFGERNEIQWFLDGNLVKRPKIKGVYLNGKGLEYNLRRAHHIYKKIELPCLNKNQVLVYHGVVNTVSLDYILSIQKPYFDNELKFLFIDCGEYGYMLTEIEYGGKPMKGVFSGSLINVKSGWYSLSSENKVKSFSLIKSGNFLDVKFKRRRG
jgi:hypothetical protein